MSLGFSKTHNSESPILGSTKYPNPGQLLESVLFISRGQEWGFALIFNFPSVGRVDKSCTAGVKHYMLLNPED